MGGQAGDHGAVKIGGQTFAILYTIKDKAGRFLHQLAPACALDASKLSLVGQPATLAVSPMARRAISRHHSHFEYFLFCFFHFFIQVSS